MPTGEPLWPLGGFHHVGSLSLRPGLGFWLADGLGVATAAPHWSSSSMAVPPHLHKWLLREDRMSWMASSFHWGPQASGLGNLLSKYTSW